MIRTLLAASVVALTLVPVAATAQGGGKIRVVGRATVEVAPDFVTVRVGVQNRAPSPTAALDQNSAAAKKIIDFAKASGIAERDIQTDTVGLSQMFKSVREPSGNMRQEPDGYQAANMVLVTLRDLSRLGTFMRQVLDQGANNIGGVNFGLADPDKAAAEARAKAVENAVRRAQGLTEAAKVKLGRILDITYPASTSGGGESAADLPVRQMARRIAVPVEAGALQVSAEVEMVWAIE